MKRLKWCMILVALAGLIAVGIIASRTIRYKMSGGIIIHDAFPGLTGKLIYWRHPKSGPSAEVWSYDLATKEKIKMLDIKHAGGLVFSTDGMWIGVVSKNGEILVTSPAKGYSHTFKLPRSSAPEELQAVIINGRLCVSSISLPWRVHRVVDIIDLETQRSIRAGIPETADADLCSRMADTNHLFVSCFSISGRENGLYMCDLDTGTTTRMAEDNPSFFDCSYAGDYVGWDEVPGVEAMAVKTYKATEGTGKSVDREHGREVCRFYGRDATLHLEQVSPCLRYALVGGGYVTGNRVTGNRMNTIYYLCDLKAGQKKLFIEVEPSDVMSDGNIGGIHWVK